MITIKLPYKSEYNFEPLLKQYNCCLRYSYNRLLDNKTEKEIYYMLKELNNCNLMNSQFFKNGISAAKGLKERFKDMKILFGGKNNFINRCKGKISKEQYKLTKYTPIMFQGESETRGNRFFNLDIIENNKIIFKPNIKEKIEIELPKLKKNIKEKLYKLEQLNKNKYGQKGYKYCIKIDLKNIYITFDEFKEKQIELKENRYIGIDMNPDNIGISIKEDNKILKCIQYDLSNIFNELLSKKLNSTKQSYYHNKLNFETIQISKNIVKLAKHYQCKYIFIENLNVNQIKSKNKLANRKNKSLWKRILFINNLKKRCSKEGIILKDVFAYYSSLIGNLQYNYVDSINASLEVGRRGYETKVLNKKDKFYPGIELKHQWKEMVNSNSSWKEIYSQLKNSKVKYRVSLEDSNQSYNVFKLNSIKSNTKIINYG